MAKNTGKNQEVEMDMTPMIDCVFLLMIFFVLVIDLSQQDLEDLILPEAKEATPDEKPPEVRPIINIAQNGRMVYKGNDWYTPDMGENTQKIKELLLFWKQSVAKDKEYNAALKNEIVNDPILIRADKWTEWHYVGVFMTACSQPEAAFWKLELALSEEDKENKLWR